MQSDRHRRSGTYAFGTALFLVLAVVLAFASGDLMLVLAVVTATAGLGLLATQRKRVPAPRQAMVQRVAPPPPQQSAAPQPPARAPRNGWPSVVCGLC